MDPTSLVIEMLKQKQFITPLEQDILDTWNELQKRPFSMSSANRQIVSNDINHPQIAVAVAVAALPTTVQKPQNQITEEDLQYILNMQLSRLVAKETEVLSNGQ